MKVVVYYRRSSDPAEAEKELAIQKQSVEVWVSQATEHWLNGWEEKTVIAEFEELETGAKSRPAFGTARKSAQANSAIILVATAKALGEGKRFSPSNLYGEPHIVCLEDPEEIARGRWAQSRNVVVYLRTSPPEASASDRSVAKQRAALQQLIAPGTHTVLAEFTEIEQCPLDAPDALETGCGPAGADRPALQAALVLCRERHAKLFIGTTDAIGRGQALRVSFDDVPFEVAYRRQDEWPERVEVSNAASAIGLLFGPHQVRNRIPVHLVNMTGYDLADALVSSSGWTLADDEILETTSSRKELGAIPHGTGSFLEGYDLYFDGDFTVSYRVSAVAANGIRFTGTATAHKGPPAKGWLPVRDWRAEETPSDPNPDTERSPGEDAGTSFPQAHAADTIHSGQQDPVETRR